MNWNKRLISLLIALGIGSLFAAGGINALIDGNRFLTPEGYTRFELTFEVPYSELLFQMTDGNWLAHLRVVASLQQGDTKAILSDMPYTLVARDETTSLSRQRTVTDKIFVTLSSPMRLMLEMTDENSGATKVWETDIPLLTDSDLFSDIDFVVPRPASDSTAFPTGGDVGGIRAWKERLIRGNIALSPRPGHVFDLSRADSVSFYYQGLHFSFDEDDMATIRETVTLVGEKDSFSVVDTLFCIGEVFDHYVKLPIVGLEAGRYDFSLQLEDMNNGRSQSRKDFVILQSSRSIAKRIFPDINDEFRLMRILEPTLNQKDWDILTPDGKSSAINWFWDHRDSIGDTPENEYFEEIRKRVSYCEENFSFYGKGWSTDRGKVYIQRGNPDEIIKGTTYYDSANYYRTEDDNDSSTSGDSKGILGSRDFQIWKYYLKGKDCSILFLDTQSNGNLRIMLKRENGNDEVYNSSWEKLMGPDFDESQLD